MKGRSDVLWPGKHDKKGRGMERRVQKQKNNIFVCIEPTHVKVVKSLRNTWLAFREPELCVVHVITEGTTATLDVSGQIRCRFFFSFYSTVDNYQSG